MKRRTFFFLAFFWGELGFLASNNVCNIFFREDIEDVDEVVGVEETPERLPISKIGKSKSEEVDVPSDRSTTGTAGEKTKLDTH